MKSSALFILHLALVFAISVSCKKKKDPAPTPAPSKYWIKYTLDGQQTSLEDGKNSYSNAASYGSSSSLCNSSMTDVDLSGCFFIATQIINGNIKNAMYVTITKDFVNSDQTEAELDSTVKVGSYNYFDCSASGLAGAEVMYIDGNGVVWTSYNGTADQTGSTFALTKVTSDPSFNAVTGVYNNKLSVAGNFNCKVYDGLGNSKTITAGSFNTRLQPVNIDTTTF
jgi:hypothetical protein